MIENHNNDRFFKKGLFFDTIKEHTYYKVVEHDMTETHVNITKSEYYIFGILKVWQWTSMYSH